MPDPNLILPLLEGFLTGDPISEHHGVRCYPAMQEKTSEKYIVKTVSVPADSSKLEALLLAGAFPDRAAAVAYYKDLAEGVEKEAILLKQLSQLEGFSGYEAWQIQPCENGESFDVCLLGKYRPTLERYLSRNPMTHLGAVNLGLDLCAALAVCRRSGYLYVDLKPSNVFICADNEYRIGDLGFIPLSSLQYASLPEKYHSVYTAPEISDAYSALNDTLDIYAVGLILYQVYNNGHLPTLDSGSNEPLPAPEYADYEMASIILKACHPDPKERWQDPAQMGQALVNYMQSNTVNDEPIVPPAVPVEVEEEVVETSVEDEPSTEEILSEVDQALEAVGVEIVEEAPAEETLVEETPAEEVSEDAPEVSEEIPEEAVVEVAGEVCEEVAEEVIEDAAEEVAEDVTDDAIIEEEPTDEVIAEEEIAEEAVEEAAEDAAEEVSEEVIVEEPVDELAEMLAQADSLIAHETPEPVVAPAPIDVPIPPRIVLTDDEPEEQEDIEEIQEEIPEETEEPEAAEEEPEEIAESDDDEPDTVDEAPKRAKRGKGLIVALICFIVTASLFIGGYLYYKYEYQQTIYNMTLSGVEDRLAVALQSDIADELLSVVCTDAYGNTKRQNVVDGVAVFTGLAPDTRYKVEVEISGFHELLGKTSGVYLTAEETVIGGLTAIAGPENGSVILNFTVRGPESPQWQVFYTAEGEEEKSVICTGHVATINGLTVGKQYTFRVEPSVQLYLIGTNTVEFTAREAIFPEDLSIAAFSGNALVVVWNAPEGTTVTAWTVRCYNDAGYDKTITVTDTTAVFENLDRSAPYTIEVCAAGMSLGSRVSLSANSVTITEFTVDINDPMKLPLSWTFEGAAPEGGWIVKYTVTGMTEPVQLNTAEPSVVIDPLIPGCEYVFEILTAKGEPVFENTFTYTTPEAEEFAGYDISAEYFDFSMCLTPNKENWDRNDLKSSDYTHTFAVGQSASFSIRLTHEYNTSSDNITTLFVIRDYEGNIVRTDTENRTWTSMWFRGYGTMTIPVMPEASGEYTVEIYFNGKYVTTQNFTIT